jgi:hypothetical protein
MSKSNFITLSSSILVYNVLLDHLEKLLDKNDCNFCPNLEVRNAIKKGYEKLKVYYAKTDDSYVYPIATSNYFYYYYFFLLKLLNIIYNLLTLINFKYLTHE